MTPIPSKPRSALFVLSKRLDSQVKWTPTEVAVAWALASYMRYDESRNRYVCWPSMATVARKTRHCDRAVRKTINEHLKRPPSERLFTFDGWINVNKPKGLRRWALVESPEAYAAAHQRNHVLTDSEPTLDRHDVPINSVATPALRSAGPARRSAESAPRSTPPARRADELIHRTDHEQIKNSARARGTDAGASESSGFQKLPQVEPDPGGDWYRECERLHGRTCNGSLGHQLRMAIAVAKAATHARTGSRSSTGTA